METADRDAIDRECSRLVVAYSHFIDFGEAARVAELFAADGVWESIENTMRGQEEIRRGFGERQRNATRASRHVCTNLAVDVIDADTAEGLVYFTLFRHDGDTGGRPAPLNGPLMVGQYRDRFVRTADGWRIAHRKAEAAFVRRRDRQDT